MTEKQVIITLEDDFGRVQTSITTKLSPPQLMDKIMEIDEQQDTIEQLEKNFDDLVQYAGKIAKRNIILDETIAKQRIENTNLKGDIERQKYIIEELRKDNYKKYQKIKELQKQ